MQNLRHHILRLLILICTHLPSEIQCTNLPNCWIALSALQGNSRVIWTLRLWFLALRSACNEIPELAASEIIAIFYIEFKKKKKKENTSAREQAEQYSMHRVLPWRLLVPGPSCSWPTATWNQEERSQPSLPAKCGDAQGLPEKDNVQDTSLKGTDKLISLLHLFLQCWGLRPLSHTPDHSTQSCNTEAT